MELDNLDGCCGGIGRRREKRQPPESRQGEYNEACDCSRDGSLKRKHLKPLVEELDFHAGSNPASTLPSYHLTEPID
ncbi:MAG: hypothetical protein GY861_26990 [bacterium]|nr:hypothetical protein [bacterium]